MKCSNPNVVFETNSIFPSYGENEVVLTWKEGNLNVNVFYESEETYEESSICFLFKHTCFYRFTSFPGVGESLIKYEKYNNIDSLVEFEHSDYKLAWEKHFNNLFKFRHFRIFFLNSNNYLEVICEDLDII